MKTSEVNSENNTDKNDKKEEEKNVSSEKDTHEKKYTIPVAKKSVPENEGIAKEKDTLEEKKLILVEDEEELEKKTVISEDKDVTKNTSDATNATDATDAIKKLTEKEKVEEIVDIEMHCIEKLGSSEEEDNNDDAKENVKETEMKKATNSKMDAIWPGKQREKRKRNEETARRNAKYLMKTRHLMKIKEEPEMEIKNDLETEVGSTNHLEAKNSPLVSLQLQLCEKGEIYKDISEGAKRSVAYTVIEKSLEFLRTNETTEYFLLDYFNKETEKTNGEENNTNNDDKMQIDTDSAIDTSNEQDDNEDDQDSDDSYDDSDDESDNNDVDSILRHRDLAHGLIQKTLRFLRYSNAKIRKNNDTVECYTVECKQKDNDEPCTQYMCQCENIIKDHIKAENCICTEYLCDTKCENGTCKFFTQKYENVACQEQPKQLKMQVRHQLQNPMEYNPALELVAGEFALFGEHIEYDEEKFSDKMHDFGHKMLEIDDRIKKLNKSENFQKYGTDVMKAHINCIEGEYDNLVRFWESMGLIMSLEPYPRPSPEIQKHKFSHLMKIAIVKRTRIEMELKKTVAEYKTNKNKYY